MFLFCLHSGFSIFLAVCDLFLISFSCPGRCCPLELLFPPVTVFCLLASGDLLVLHVPVPPDVFARRSCFLGTSCTDHVLFAPPSAVFAPCCARRLFGGTRQTAPYRPYLRHSALLRDRWPGLERMSWRLTPRYFDARTPLLFAYLPPGFEGSLLLFEHELFVGSNRSCVGGGRRASAAVVGWQTEGRCFPYLC